MQESWLVWLSVCSFVGVRVWPCVLVKVILYLFLILAVQFYAFQNSTPMGALTRPSLGDRSEVLQVDFDSFSEISRKLRNFSIEKSRKKNFSLLYFAFQLLFYDCSGDDLDFSVSRALEMYPTYDF